MKNTNRRCVTVWMRFFLIVMMVGSLASCKPKPSIVLLDTSCEPPCWHDITPGMSTKKDVIAILPKIPEVAPNSVEDTAITTGGIHDHIKWRFDSGSGDFGGTTFFKDGAVSTIEIRPKKGALMLDDAIRKLGEPELTFAYLERGEIDRMIIYLLYPTKGYALTYDIGYSRDGSAAVEPTHPIEHVYFFDPKLFDELVTIGPLGYQDPATLKQNMRPWKGYGDIFYFEK